MMPQTKHRHWSQAEQALKSGFDISYVTLDQKLDLSEPVSISVKELTFKVLVRIRARWT